MSRFRVNYSERKRIWYVLDGVDEIVYTSTCELTAHEYARLSNEECNNGK